MRNKSEILSGLKPLPQGEVGAIAIDHFTVVIDGNTALVAVEMQEHLDYFGQILRSRFRTMDTWKRTPAGWRLIGQQVTAVLKDPPAAKLSQAMLCTNNGYGHDATDGAPVKLLKETPPEQEAAVPLDVLAARFCGFISTVSVLPTVTGGNVTRCGVATLARVWAKAGVRARSAMTRART